MSITLLRNVCDAGSHAKLISGEMTSQQKCGRLLAVI